MQGLENLGSTCAINSLIQIICRTTYLRNIILNDNIPLNTLSHELKEILDLMHNKNHSLSPKRFINRLYNHMNGIFNIGEQIDISELWMFLYDKLAIELGKSQSILQPMTLDPEICIEDNVSLSLCKPLHDYCDYVLRKMNNNKTSEWLKSSQGIFLNMVKCDNCNHINYNFEPFISIPLDIPETSSSLPSVANMLRNYLQVQKLHGDWKCDKCKTFSHYSKAVKLWKLPRVLIFTIQRFLNTAKKNIKPICVNKTLCVKTNSVISNMENDMVYVCSSFAMHYGNLFGGHYTAICKNDDKYILYDDINISQLNKCNIDRLYENNKDVYMIIYTSLE